MGFLAWSLIGGLALILFVIFALVSALSLG